MACDDGKPTQTLRVVELRAQAERARKLADGMGNDTDRALLNALADKLEAKADALERGGEL